MMVCSCGEGDHPSRTQHEEGCPLHEAGATVLVFRNSLGQPVAVPEDVVAAGERPYRAYQMHLAGESWATIARVEQYADPAAAAYDVQRYIEEGKRLVTTRTRRDQLTLEVARLDALQAIVWKQAEQGHLPAIKTAMDLIMSRSKILGLAQMSEDEGGEDGPTTVIIESDDDYQASLEQAAQS